MKKIQMVDLHQQYQNIKGEIDKSIQEVIDNTAFIKGPQVGSFEKELSDFLGVKHVVTCANGTDALQIALMALNLNQGDEVITSSFTFIATVEVIALLGLKPVFAEVDKETFNLDPASVKANITPRTKVILPVHLFGQSAPMEELMDIARQHSLYVIEDACQATGTDYIFKDGHTQKAGTIGHIGCTSFFPSKNLGCFGDGGAMYTNDEKLYTRLSMIANHGMKVRYYHDEIGVNSRLDTIQAAVLKVKLKHLREYNEARQKAAAFYDKELGLIKGLKIPKRISHSTHIFHQYTLQVNGFDRDALRKFLESKDIPAMVYYPVPIHMQNAYKKYGYKEGDFPVSEDLSKIVLSLPMHTELATDQLQFICDQIKSFCQP